MKPGAIVIGLIVFVVIALGPSRVFDYLTGNVVPNVTEMVTGGGRLVGESVPYWTNLLGS